MRKQVSKAEGLLPLMAAEFQVLLALADSERHGYGIMAEVRDRTGGKVVMGPGTLYGTIKRLLSRRLIEEAAEGKDASLGDERRRYYRLTALGRRIAVAEAERMVNLVGDARSKELIPGSKGA